MSKRIFTHAIWPVLFAAQTPIAAIAQEPEQLAPVLLQGTNTLRLETYDNQGDPAGSPFAFSGGQGFNEFSLNARQQLSPYRSWQGQLNGVANASRYRAANRDELLIERWNLKAECGDCGSDGSLPLRAELGDFQAFFSLGSLQRSLKGVQIETQPSFEDGRLHSVQLLAGANSPDWRNFDADDDQTLAASWMVADQALGSLAVNLMRNQRATGNLDQTTFSLGGQTAKWRALNREWTAEVELSHFSGDHTNAAGGRDRNENGVFGELKGKHAKGKGDWRLRYEEYGGDYQPNGAVVSSDRRSAEAHLAWRSDAGINARGRLQLFRDALETANPSDTRTIGINLGGPIARELLGEDFSKVNATLSAFTQQNDDATNTVDRRTDSLNLNLTFPISATWSGRGGLAVNNVKDRIGAGDSRARTLTLGASRQISLAGFKGNISPSLNLTRTRTANLSRDLNLGLAANLAKGPHSVAVNTSFVDNRPGAAANSETTNLTMNYRYQSGRSSYGIEFVENYRDPDAAQSSTGMKLAAFWSYSFDERIGAAPEGGAAAALTGGGPLDLQQIAPGLRLGEIASIQDIAFTPFGEFLVAETQVLKGNDQRQRLVVKKFADTVDFSALIIDFDATGSLDSAAQIFEEIRRELVNRYGTPDSFFERGTFSANLAADVNSDAFIRTMEWQSANGVLRFGIPRRLDGVVRMELQHAARFRPATDTLWSVDEIQ